MTWFKADDKLHETHRRVSLAADGLWVRAGTWSSDLRTDGFVPEDIATRWATRTQVRRLAGELVTEGLWESSTSEDPEPGWRFVGWAEDQTVGPFQSEPIGQRLRQQILERDRFTCQECGATDALQIDHIHPRIKGGTNHPTNLQVLCQPCNARKGAR